MPFRERLGTLRIHRTPPVAGRVVVPGSKSETNRALVAAALAKGTSTITCGLVADDTDSMVGGLALLGAEITVQSDEACGRTWSVTGTGGAISGQVEIDAGLAGTTLRFLVAAAVLASGEVTVTGPPGLRRRPVAPFLSALRAAGAEVEGTPDEGGIERVPVHVGARTGRRLGGAVALDASQSSQFASAVLLAAPYFDDPLELSVTGLSAAGYVALTCEVMARFGVTVERIDGRFVVPPLQPYRGSVLAVAPDASAASHLFVLAMATRGAVTVERLLEASSQPDFAVLGLLEAFGAAVRRDSDGAVTVLAPDELSPIDVDLAEMPDQLPNAAVLAAVAPGTSRLSGLSVTRFHETDRLAAMASELTKCGVAVEERRDGLVVRGGGAAAGAAFSSHGDHRLAMALTALGAAVGECTLEGAEAVTKTYPGFFADATALGLAVGPEP